MQPWQIVVAPLTAQAGIDACPWGLLTLGQNDNGAIIHRCSLLAGHTEPHLETSITSINGKDFLQITTMWVVVHQWLNSSGASGPEPPAAQPEHHGSEP